MRTSLLALQTLLIAGCQVARNPYVNKEITKEELKYHIEILASDSLQGREAGGQGHRLAVDYLVSEMQSYGLRPLGDSGRYEQDFEIITGVRAGEESHLETADRSMKLHSDFRPLTFSADTSAEGTPIYAGYGISAPAEGYDDYANLDVHGKIVVVSRYAPDGDNPHSTFYTHSALRKKVSEAENRGAIGVIVVNGEGEDTPVELRYDRAGGNYKIPAISVTREVAAILLGIQTKNLDAVESAIRGTRKTKSLTGVGVIRMKTRVIVERSMTSNVVGMIPGTSDEYVVIGAHADHLGMGQNNSLYRGEPAIHNGADDNASGTSSILELAQYFVQRTLKRNVIVIAFSAEEMGLLGSKHFVEHPPVELSKTVAMLNFDMVGRMKDRKLVVYGIGTSPGFRELLNAHADTSRVHLSLKNDGNGPSDFAEFYRKGIPVLAFFTDLHEDYHRPSDDADKINVEGQWDVVQMAARIIEQLAQDSARPVFTRVQGETSGAMRGFKVSLSVVPSYSFDGEGMKVDDVNPGGPGDQAGMKKGDVIVKFGGKPIRNIYDYTYALGEFNPGQQVDVVVRRGSEEVTLSVKLEAAKRR